MRMRLVAVLIACCLLAAPSIGRAQPLELDAAWATCANTKTDDLTPEPQQRVNACTAVIDYVSVRDPYLVPALTHRSEAYLDLENPQNALADLDRAIRFEPGSRPALARRGSLYLREFDNFERAMVDFNAAVRTLSSRAESMERVDMTSFSIRCWARAYVGRELNRALFDCNYALRMDPRNANALDTRALVHFKLGEYEAAFADYEAATRARAEFAHAMYGRGVTHIRLGRVAEGQADIAAALALDEDIAETYAEYGITP